MSIADRVNRAARKVPTWPVYLLTPVPGLLVFYQGLTGKLGPEPVKALEHELGLYALWLLMAGLCITPLRRYAGINLLRFRRAIGLGAFFYVSMHLLVWAVLDVQALGAVVADIVKRPYIAVGMIAFVLMVPLALTSTNRTIRALGPAWRKLHKLTYVVAILGAVHFVMLRKGIQLEPVLYLAGVIGLLTLRMPWKAYGRSVVRSS